MLLKRLAAKHGFGQYLLQPLPVHKKPLYFQSVGYTFDQGRDFLKAAEMILDKNPTFIGPTTGIQGIFHGAWYYYLLLIPFLLLGGVPIGFYYFNFLFHLLSLLVLMFFIRKWFGSVISLLIGAIIAFILNIIESKTYGVSILNISSLLFYTLFFISAPYFINFGKRAFTYIASISFGIYLIHEPLMSMVYSYLPITNKYLFILVLYLIGLIIPIIFIYLISVFSKKIYTYLFG